VTPCEVAEILAERCGLSTRCLGGYAMLVEGDGVAAYVFPREELPRLGVYGYYGGHFVEVWEGKGVESGVEILRRDPVLSCIYRALLGLGERAIRVMRLRGKYGDPHLSLSVETRGFQVIREYVVGLGGATVPRIRPGGYEWRKARDIPCGGGLYGLLDGVWVRLGGGVIGLVRGLEVYSKCRLVAGRSLYEAMAPFERRRVGSLELVKIPYSVAASLARSDEAACCGFRARISVAGAETPIWRKVADRFEVRVLRLRIERAGGDGGEGDDKN